MAEDGLRNPLDGTAPGLYNMRVAQASEDTMMTVEKMAEAGKLLGNCSWTDEELDACLKGVKLALAFLEGGGQKWHLAIAPLRHEVECLTGFQESRAV